MNDALNGTSREALAKVTYILVILIGVVTILAYGQAYIIPFVVALIIWFIIHELRENLQMIPWVRRKVPIWLQSSIAFVIIAAVITAVINMVYFNAVILYESVDHYIDNFQKVLVKLNHVLGFDVANYVNEHWDRFDATAFASSTVNFLSSLMGDGFLILIYIVFLLVEETIFPLKLKAFYPDVKEQDKKEELFYKMDQNIGRYLRLKTLVSFITGFLSYIALVIFGVEAALFWAFMIFILNYIPTIGSLIATLFPAIFIVLQTAELAPFIYVLLSVGTVQIIVGNIVEPKLMGTSLNLSSLVVILSLTIWGAIWGIMGMILSIPITVMMMIVFEEIPSLRFIAIALSEKGQLNEPLIRPKKRLD